MILNYQIQQAEQPSDLEPIVLIHGLFGSLSNLGMLARAFDQRTVIQLDVRNHGLSEHSAQMNYDLMAQDVLDTLDELNIQKFSLIGHSMGGKISMKVAEKAENRVVRLIVLDITPSAYQENHHEQIFKALFAVQEAAPQSRLQATEIMKQFVREDMVIQFLLKSFTQGKWRFNLNAIFAHYSEILSWNEISPYTNPVLFLRGGVSPYIHKPEHFEAIQQQFPNAEVKEILNAGHWLHAEKTDEVLLEIQNFLKA
ncbi:alpha/beta fold hydrolase [Acinetobacter kanungonis]|uniref:alpha/beta fold hydrolase n=1 Tax=Acinetobacter kanungonis TaxID=2699469 RepID=UPI00137AAF72|nr:alpha/beta fold hydrolase [Acinetobacter kanungonis]NCI79121.1 alpha/beta fold hydrolase [Acinetobacter kanungonis]